MCGPGPYDAHIHLHHASLLKCLQALQASQGQMLGSARCPQARPPQKQLQPLSEEPHERGSLCCSGPRAACVPSSASFKAVNCAPWGEFPLPRGKGSQNDPSQCDLVSLACFLRLVAMSCGKIAHRQGKPETSSHSWSSSCCRGVWTCRTCLRQGMQGVLFCRNP